MYFLSQYSVKSLVLYIQFMHKHYAIMHNLLSATEQKFLYIGWNILHVHFSETIQQKVSAKTIFQLIITNFNPKSEAKC